MSLTPPAALAAARAPGGAGRGEGQRLSRAGVPPRLAGLVDHASSASAAGELGGLAVVGDAQRRATTGALRPLRAERGAVFTPDEPFAAGERVRVDVGHPVRGAGGASSYTFRTSEPGRGQLEEPGRPAAADARAPPGLPARAGRCCARSTARRRSAAASCAARRRGPPPGRLLVSPRPPTGSTPRAAGAHGPVRQRARSSGTSRATASSTTSTCSATAGEPVLTYYLRARGGPGAPRDPRPALPRGRRASSRATATTRTRTSSS